MGDDVFFVGAAVSHPCHKAWSVLLPAKGPPELVLCKR